MESVTVSTLDHILHTINDFTPLGIIALLGIIIFFMVWKSPLKPLETSLAEVKDNHLHELPAMAESLRDISATLQRMEVKMGEEFSYLKAKVNGR